MKTVILFLAVLMVSMPVVSAQSRCITQWNPLWKQYETRCSDGATSTEKFNPFSRQWESATQGPASPKRQRCYTAYNALVRQWETVCR